jgi:hypothetical protein
MARDLRPRVLIRLITAPPAISDPVALAHDATSFLRFRDRESWERIQMLDRNANRTFAHLQAQWLYRLEEREFCGF